jgi:isocitrate dehydrogenase
MSATPITVAHGDGIGPEIMAATLRILDAAGARIAPETIAIGKAVYERGFTAGIEPAAWESIRRTHVLLKAPVTTPQGGGFKSINVTIRKTLGLFANVRPCVAYAPFVRTRHPRMDVVIIRENEEDLYGGIEHRQTDEVFQCLKLITRPGCERVAKFAFEYARSHGRKKITCFTKDNIMKLTDGLFHQVCDEIAAGYPDIESDHMIIDIGAARLADSPERFDMILTSNLYGDIISDIAAQVAGSVGLAPSANIGEQGAMFEAIHGSAPDIAGQGIANPSGLLLAAVQMLIHINQGDVASIVHNAWLRTIEEGIHTGDIYDASVSRERVGTAAFADAVIARLGQKPIQLTPVEYAVALNPVVATREAHFERAPAAVKELVGVDVFVHWRGEDATVLAGTLQLVDGDGVRLTMITNRGVKVWPGGVPETFCADHWRCRFEAITPTGRVSHNQIIRLLSRINEAGFDFIKTENLCNFDGQPGYAMGQGQ